jgi:hypothetical protein
LAIETDILPTPSGEIGNVGVDAALLADREASFPLDHPVEKGVTDLSCRRSRHNHDLVVPTPEADMDGVRNLISFGRTYNYDLSEQLTVSDRPRTDLHVAETFTKPITHTLPRYDASGVEVVSRITLKDSMHDEVLQQRPADVFRNIAVGELTAQRDECGRIRMAIQESLIDHLTDDPLAVSLP